jgi:hypothetical protein
MIALTKSFRKQLKAASVSIADIIVGINRVLNRGIMRQGDTLLGNSFLKLKNCSVAKIRIGTKQQARMLVIFLIIDNLKIPFFIANKNDKRLGGNLSITTMEKIAMPKAVKVLGEFYNDEFEKIDE